MRVRNLDNRAQGAFEYILLLAGVLLLAVFITIILRSSVLPSSSTQLNTSIGAWQNSTRVNCTGPNGSCGQLG